MIADQVQMTIKAGDGGHAMQTSGRTWTAVRSGHPEEARAGWEWDAPGADALGQGRGDKVQQ